MALGELRLETVILIVLLFGAGFYVLRHIIKLILDGEPGSNCQDCLWHTKKNPNKDKPAF